MYPGSNPYVEDKTEVLYDPNEIVRRVVESCYTVKYTIFCCVDTNGLSIFVIPNHPVTYAYIDMKNRGVKLRLISEITKDNLSYCKELIGIGEIRHFDVKRNFGIADGMLYHAGATVNKSGPPPQLIVSTVKAMVQQKQYFFEMLSRKAIPAKQGIKEMEEPTKRQFIDTIRDSVETNI